MGAKHEKFHTSIPLWLLDAELGNICRFWECVHEEAKLPCTQVPGTVVQLAGL